MNTGIIASRYARALYKYVSEVGNVRQAAAQVRRLQEVLATTPALQQVLDDPAGVSPAQKMALFASALAPEKLLPELGNLGFDLSSLGGHSFAINGVPAGIDGLDPVVLLRQMVEDSGTLPTQVSSLHSQLALSLARHAAIPYGQLLSNAEIENVINQLFSCSNVNYTPDGKAILCILPQTDIEQLLG